LAKSDLRVRHKRVESDLEEIGLQGPTRQAIFDIKSDLDIFIEETLKIASFIC